MKWRFVLVVVLLLLSGCKPPAERGGSSGTAGGLEVRIETETEPRLGPTAVLVRVSEDGRPIGGAAVEVTGDMTHAGMAPVIAKAEETEPGLYRAGTFAFTMAGDWFLTAEVELPDGRKASATRALTVTGQR